MQATDPFGNDDYITVAEFNRRGECALSEVASIRVYVHSMLACTRLVLQYLCHKVNESYGTKKYPNGHLAVVYNNLCEHHLSMRVECMGRVGLHHASAAVALSQNYWVIPCKKDPNGQLTVVCHNLYETRVAVLLSFHIGC